MRLLFVAIPLPETIRERIGRLQEPLPAAARKVRPEQAHLTLKFLGLVAEEKLPKLTAALAALPFKPFDLKTTKIGSFHRVLWLGVRLTSNLAQLQQHVERAVRPFAMHDPRAYKPHITLARFEELSESVFHKVQELNEPMRWGVDSYGLFASHMGPRGVTYTLLHSFR